MRALFTALVLSWLTAGPALACEMIFEPGSPNESYAQVAARQTAYLRRLQRERQEEYWRTSDVVFLARVTSLQLPTIDRVDVTLRPIVQIHGGARLPEMVLDHYDPHFGSDCGTTDYALIGDLVIVYAERSGLGPSSLRLGSLKVLAVEPVYRIRDPQISTALREAAVRLRRNEH